MDKWRKAYYILIAIGIILAVVSFIILPDTVVAQVSTSDNPNRLPKVIAVLIPLVTTVGGGIFGIAVLEKKIDVEGNVEEMLKRRGLICSIIGVVFYGLIIWINLFK